MDPRDLEAPVSPRHLMRYDAVAGIQTDFSDEAELDRIKAEQEAIYLLADEARAEIEAEAEAEAASAASELHPPRPRTRSGGVAPIRAKRARIIKEEIESLASWGKELDGMGDGEAQPEDDGDSRPPSTSTATKYLKFPDGFEEHIEDQISEIKRINERINEGKDVKSYLYNHLSDRVGGALKEPNPRSRATQHPLTLEGAAATYLFEEHKSDLLKTAVEATDEQWKNKIRRKIHKMK